MSRRRPTGSGGAAKSVECPAVANPALPDGCLFLGQVAPWEQITPIVTEKQVIFKNKIPCGVLYGLSDPFCPIVAAGGLSVRCAGIFPPRQECVFYFRFGRDGGLPAVYAAATGLAGSTDAEGGTGPEPPRPPRRQHLAGRPALAERIVAVPLFAHWSLQGHIIAVGGKFMKCGKLRIFPLTFRGWFGLSSAPDFRTVIVPRSVRQIHFGSAAHRTLQPCPELCSFRPSPKSFSISPWSVVAGVCCSNHPR